MNPNSKISDTAIFEDTSNTILKALKKTHEKITKDRHFKNCL